MIAPPPTAPAARPLVVTTDEQLLDGLLRVLAAAGCDPQVLSGGAGLRRAHREAPLVLLGADMLASTAVRALPRRAGVVVATAGSLDAAHWSASVELGAERVVSLPADEAWLLTRAAAAARPATPTGPVVAVGGCCGGAGASTFATALALVAAESGPVLLVDTDPWGGGLDLVLGAERGEGLRWPELTQLRGRVSGEALLSALPEVGGVHVLSADRGTPVAIPAEAVVAATDAARNDGRPVVVDLPRAGGPVESVLAEADMAVLLVPDRLRAVSAARSLTGASGPWSSAALVTRPVTGGLSSREVSDLVGRPVVAVLPQDRAASARSERGEPPALSARAPFGAAARQVLATVHERLRAAS